VTREYLTGRRLRTPALIGTTQQTQPACFKHIDTTAGRHVARNFDRGGKQQPKFQHLIIKPLVFKASSIKGAFFWRIFSELLCSDLSQQIQSSFSLNWQNLSLFLEKLQASILDENYHLLEKLSCKKFVKISMFQVQDLQYDFCSQYCSWARGHCGRHYDCVFIFTRFWCTPTLVQSKPSSDFALRRWLAKLVYKTCAHKKCGSYPVLERLVDLCSW